MTETPHPSMREMVLAFLKIGCISFGGPLVALGLIHRECVERKRLVSAAWFAETMGLMEIVPGPTATEMAIAIGIHKHDRLGGLLCGLAYVLPGFFVITTLSVAYFRFNTIGFVSGALIGLKSGAMAVLTLVSYKLTRSTIRNRTDALLACVAFAALLTDHSLVLACLLAGTVHLVLEHRYFQKILGTSPTLWALSAPVLFLGFSLIQTQRLPTLFLGTLKAGALVQGGGYVIASFLSQDFVTRLQWLTPQEFLAGLALAQFKPGPVTLLASFVGYKAAGLSGAVVGMLGAFLPCFATLLIIGPHIEKLRGGRTLSTFIRGIGAAAIGSILAVCVQLFQPAISNLSGGGIYIIGLVALYWFEPGWILAAAALIGTMLL